ncbi:MAG TPA: hypothetical protein VJL33_05025 [Candidatus Bathyarchaeia archaeon]|nr:hypothetical protein [Candidatus Bathyarchaeia archaeon]
MNKIPVTPIPWTRPELGVYKSDLTRIGAKDGDWVGVEYNGKTIDMKVRARVKKEGWADNLIWIGKDQREPLNLPDISACTETSPPKDVKVDIWKHQFPKGQDLARIYAAAVTLVLTVLGVVLQGTLGLLPKGDPLQIPVGIALISVAIIGALAAFAAVVFQRQ